MGQQMGQQMRQQMGQQMGHIWDQQMGHIWGQQIGYIWGHIMQHPGRSFAVFMLHIFRSISVALINLTDDVRRDMSFLIDSHLVEENLIT
jgi:hypothetical protein